MCGICGVVYRDGRPVESAILERMNATLTHRGPDGVGYFYAAGVGLAMRRLSILDVAGSDQPLYNADASVGVVFNGEIYNYRALRDDLRQHGHSFRTDGDGEVIPHLYDAYGDDLPSYLRGQFAFALWDKRQRRLLLARDRMGQKPLYYYEDAEKLVFASEIKAILAHPDVARRAIFDDDPAALALYLGYGYMPAPNTAFQSIEMLSPGHVLLYPGERGQRPYWRMPGHQPADDTPDTPPELIQTLRDKLTEATRLRMIADVPLGAFLSGGLDSSLIVALMQRHSNQTVKTFSIGFADSQSFDETPYAQQVAGYLGTDHTAFMVEADALDLLPRLVWHHDQPFADSSAIPTYLVSQMTRQHVTVALTGDGGDELFAGYERFYAAKLFGRLQGVPRPLWRMAVGLINWLPEGTGYADKLKRAGRFARAASQPLELAYFDLVRLFDAEQIRHLTGQEGDRAGQHFQQAYFGQGVSAERILDANMQTYLPDDLLIKADRCSMAASLEARAPFLDHELVEWAAGIALQHKLRGSSTKYILKRAAEGYLPPEIIHRRKHGFGVPLGQWLRQDMSLVREMLHNLDGRGLFRAAALQTLMDEHSNGQRDHGFRLWTLLTLESWYGQFIDAFQPATSPAQGVSA